MPQVRIKSGATTIQAEVVETGTQVSQFSGADLRTLVVNFYTHNDIQRELVDAVLKTGVATILDENGEPSYDCKIHQKQYSFQSGSNHTTYTWELSEKETLTIDKLIVGGLELTPYAYEEKLDGDALIIEAKLKISAEEADRLGKLKPYFPVVRRGISDSPRQMRTGRPLWSKHGEEIKYQLILVEQCYDRPGQHGLFEPEWSASRDLLIGVTESFKGLLDLLLAKGVVTEDEKLSLLETSEEKLREASHSLYRVEDLDLWAGPADEQE